MKVTLYLSDKPREYAIGDALAAGFRKHGETVAVVKTHEYVRPDWETQLAVVIGIKGMSKKVMEEYRRGGRNCMLVDKSYFVRNEYVRLSVDAFQPAYAHAIPRSHDRWNRIASACRIELRPRRPRGKFMIYAGSSQKYCDWHGLGDVSEYARSVCHAINKQTHSEMPLLYRPKPSWVAGHPDDVEEVAETEFSGPDVKLGVLLENCHAIITHGSNAAVEGIIGGVPAVVISSGACAAEPMAGRGISAETVLEPTFPTDAARLQWLADLAYCQFNVAELTDGTAWEIVSPNTMKGCLAEIAGMSALDAVVEQYRSMHRSPKMFRGGSIKGHIEAIADCIKRYDAKTLLDYGCGKGIQYTEMKVHERWGVAMPRLYDPAVAGIDKKPAGTFDGAINTDVMEHIPEAHVDEVFREVVGYATKFVFFCIFTEPSRKVLPSGENCHITVRPPDWWLQRICGLTGGAITRDYDVSKPLPGGGFERFKHYVITGGGPEIVVTFRGSD